MKKETLRQKEVAESMRRFKNGLCPCPCHFREVQCAACDGVVNPFSYSKTDDGGLGCFMLAILLFIFVTALYLFGVLSLLL